MSTCEGIFVEEYMNHPAQQGKHYTMNSKAACNQPILYTSKVGTLYEWVCTLKEDHAEMHEAATYGGHWLLARWYSQL